MIKYITLLIIVFSTLVTNAGDKTRLAKSYEIISDTIDKSIPEGKCLVTGIVLFNENPVSDVLIYHDKEETTQSSKKGEFRILVDTSAKYIIFDMGGQRTGYIEFYTFRNQHKIVAEVYIPDWDEMIEVDKPVIYLYSDEKIEANISISTLFPLTFTYPYISSNKDWDVQVSNEGIQYKNNLYPYLFWEGQANLEFVSYTKQDNQIIGDLIHSDTLISYLEDKLTSIGLNQKEKTDFITFWTPKMITTPYNIVQFKIDDQVREVSELDITPTPDNSRRVYMLFTGFEQDPRLTLEPNKECIPFVRNGFNAVEWGGSEIPKTLFYRAL